MTTCHFIIQLVGFSAAITFLRVTCCPTATGRSPAARQPEPLRRSGRLCFFFQAEDGIRDYKVTGVQTCALPISAIVTIAAAHRLAIVPFGAGTSLEGHVNAIHGGVTIDLREMNAITRVSVDDLEIGRASCRERV